MRKIKVFRTQEIKCSEVGDYSVCICVRVGGQAEGCDVYVPLCVCVCVCVCVRAC